MLWYLAAGGSGPGWCARSRPAGALLPALQASIVAVVVYELTVHDIISPTISADKGQASKEANEAQLKAPDEILLYSEGRAFLTICAKAEDPETYDRLYKAVLDGKCGGTRAYFDGIIYADEDTAGGTVLVLDAANPLPAPGW